MPANLPPYYHVLEEKFRTARTTPEKIALLEEMYALLPKHKGTDKLQADLKKRISKLRQDPKGAATAKARPAFHVPKEGAGQVFLVGAPNCGKSALVRTVTRAEPEVADYAFTTRRPTPGMMMYEDVPIQLVDLPPFSPEFTEGWVPQMVRYGDALLLMNDLSSDDALDHIEEVLELLADAKVVPVAPTAMPAPDDRDPAQAYVPTLMVGTKADDPHSSERFELLMELHGARWPAVTISLHDEPSLTALRRRVFELLAVIRVYSKMPGKEPDLSRPYLLPVGATLEDFAAAVHRDFAEKLTFARIWGEARFAGQRVTREFVLSDRDVVELHI